jgi:hypothetical protein
MDSLQRKYQSIFGREFPIIQENSERQNPIVFIDTSANKVSILNNNQDKYNLDLSGSMICNNLIVETCHLKTNTKIRELRTNVFKNNLLEKDGIYSKTILLNKNLKTKNTNANKVTVTNNFLASSMITTLDNFNKLIAGTNIIDISGNISISEDLKTKKSMYSKDIYINGNKNIQNLYINDISIKNYITKQKLVKTNTLYISNIESNANSHINFNSNTINLGQKSNILNIGILDNQTKTININSKITNIYNQTHTRTINSDYINNNILQMNKNADGRDTLFNSQISFNNNGYIGLFDNFILKTPISEYKLHMTPISNNYLLSDMDTNINIPNISCHDINIKNTVLKAMSNTNIYCVKIPNIPNSEFMLANMDQKIYNTKIFWTKLQTDKLTLKSLNVIANATTNINYIIPDIKNNTEFLVSKTNQKISNVLNFTNAITTFNDDMKSNNIIPNNNNTSDIQDFNSIYFAETLRINSLQLNKTNSIIEDNNIIFESSTKFNLNNNYITQTGVESNIIKSHQLLVINSNFLDIDSCLIIDNNHAAIKTNNRKITRFKSDKLLCNKITINKLKHSGKTHSLGRKIEIIDSDKDVITINSNSGIIKANITENYKLKVYNSCVTQDSVVFCNIQHYDGLGVPIVTVENIQDKFFDIQIFNLDTSNKTNGIIHINFVIA